MRTQFYDADKGATIDLMGQGSTYLVTRVEVNRPSRGRGYAREMMERVCAEADEHGITLVLGVEPDYSIGSLGEEALRLFYESLGFTAIIVDGEETYPLAMQRQPKP